MKLDLQNFLNSDEVTYEFEGKLDSEESNYDIDNIGLQFPILYKGTVYDLGDELMMDMKIDYKLDTNCDRCLKEIVKSVSSNTKAYFVKNNDIEIDDSADNQYFDFTREEIFLDDIIISQIITDKPMKILCKDDCLGLCPKCGKDLNEGPCNCEKEVDIDPRFAKMLDLFKDDEEV